MITNRSPFQIKFGQTPEICEKADAAYELNLAIRDEALLEPISIEHLHKLTIMLDEVKTMFGSNACLLVAEELTAAISNIHERVAQIKARNAAKDHVHGN